MPHPKPVEKVELSGRHIGLRIAGIVLCLIVAGVALSRGIVQLFSAGAGWQEIEVSASAGATCADEFVLLYELGSDGKSASAEARQLRALYTDTCRSLHMLFHTVESFEGVTNLHDINLHPNETLTVHPVLYQALETVQRSGDRTLYLGPVCERYGEIFFCTDDAQLADFDPLTSADVRAAYETLAAFARDARAVDLQLLGEGQVRLFVSEEYLSYAQREGVERFLDFGWMRNAFLADAIADALTDAGFTHGSLSSYDGFNRNLDSRGLSYALHLYDRSDGTVYPAAVMNYAGPMSFVCLRDFPLDAGDARRMYVCRDGSIRTDYLSVEDGRCHSAVGSLVCYASELSCAALALCAAPVYVSEALDEQALRRLAGDGVQAVWCRDRTVFGTDASLTLTQLYEADGVRYTASLG